MSGHMNLTLKVWRQKNSATPGKFVTYKADDISPDMSFLEMLDVVNEDLVKKNEDPIHFDHDCREGICGMCSLVINGEPHGPKRATTTCQLHMRSFSDNDTIVIEPWRAAAFPVVKDLVTNRAAFERIQQAGGYVSVGTGGVPDANEIPIPKPVADEAFNSAECIGCGACVAACKNASAMLFVSAKISQLALLPQGQPERYARAEAMVLQMDEEGFGGCTNTYACEAQCPKEIKVTNIARMNREFFNAELIKS
ncbi:MAG TPA: succinate dehydrogenase/fumarate reductase iron-sulfur subunit [Pelobium sp.]|nr:succinate dehydrogenase/fumarate reductase iron-sulfur subunit [Pelobium sp.]